MNASRAWLEKDFYRVLGVPENADQDQVKRAYRKLARELHPDRNPGNAQAEERMKDVAEAYDVLSDPAKRREYDEVRRMGRVGGGMGFGGGAGPGGWQGVNTDEAGFDLGDILGGIFGGARGRRRAAPRRGSDIEASLRISFEDAARGVTVPVRVPRDAPCSVCNGSGDRSGHAQTCPTCGGSGQIGEGQMGFTFMRACPTCGGRGRVVQDPCPSCGASGVERRVDEVKVKIPAGIADGARIRVRGRGEAAPGGTPGDLYVQVSVDPHPVFARSGNDLTVSVPVSFAGAALGSTVEVPTLDGRVTLRVPPGTQPGGVLRVRSRGLPGKGGARGDLLVTVKVEVPRSLSEEERALIEQLAQVQGMNGHAEPRVEANEGKL